MKRISFLMFLLVCCMVMTHAQNTGGAGGGATGGGATTGNAGGTSARGAVRIVDITDHTSNFSMLRTPWQDREGVQIRPQVLVRLVDTYKAFDRTAVDHDIVIDSFFDLAGGDGNIFKLTKDIRELQANELYVIFLDEANNVFLCVLTHGLSPLEKIKK